MRILAFAYACEPGRGSEPGAGWAWARMLAQIEETWVITRRDYAASIERALESTPERENLRFVYVELPERFRGWQRDLRGLRIYYLLWQIAALREARRLQRTVDFDVVWHLTWATAWYGSLAALAGRPFVYGPVGGCVRPPLRLLPDLGLKGILYEGARAIAQVWGRSVNPLSRLSWRRADLILAQNDETRAWFPRAHRAKTRIFPNAVIREDMGGAVQQVERSGPPTLLFAGRLAPWKGVFLCLRALALLPGWRLVICGAGGDEERMKRLARRMGLERRVDWLGWLSQDEVLHQMSNADVFLFPSLHEDAGVVVAEARAAGLPTVCLARGGPPLLVGASGISVAASGGTGTIARRLADATLTCFDRGRPLEPADGEASRLTLHARAQALEELLMETLRLPGEADASIPTG